MAAEAITPVDELTGMVLPIIPSCEPMTWKNAALFNEHHSNHPRPELIDTLEGNALRNSQIQIVPASVHNIGPNTYHALYKGPPLTRGERKIAAQILVACAGYIPEEGIVFEGGEPGQRQMTRRELEYLHTPSSDDPYGYKYFRYGYEPIRDFFRQYVINQKLDHLPSNIFDQFLTAKDEDQRRKAGRFLLTNATGVAADQVREIYSRLWRARRFHPAMPAEPQVLLLDKLGRQEHRDEMLVDLETSLRARLAA